MKPLLYWLDPVRVRAVTNYDLSPIFLKTLDDTKYGAQSVASQALL